MVPAFMQHAARRGNRVRRCPDVQRSPRRRIVRARFCAKRCNHCAHFPPEHRCTGTREMVARILCGLCVFAVHPNACRKALLPCPHRTSVPSVFPTRPRERERCCVQAARTSASRSTLREHWFSAQTPRQGKSSPASSRWCGPTGSRTAVITLVALAALAARARERGRSEAVDAGPRATGSRCNVGSRRCNRCRRCRCATRCRCGRATFGEDGSDPQARRHRCPSGPRHRRHLQRVRGASSSPSRGAFHASRLDLRACRRSRRARRAIRRPLRAQVVRDSARPRD